MGLGLQWRHGKIRHSQSRSVCPHAPSALCREFPDRSGFDDHIQQSLGLSSFALPLASLYYAITRADEQRMEARFGLLYESYVTKHATRFVPQLGKLVAALQTTCPFNWVLAWSKEYNSVCAWTAGIAALAFYKRAISYGWQVAWQKDGEWLIVSGSCGILAAVSPAGTGR